MSSRQDFPLLSLPNELIVAVAEHLPTITDLHSLLLTSRRLSTLLPTVLHTHAAKTTHALPALYWAISTGNKPMTILLLHKSKHPMTVRTPSRTLLHRTPHRCPAKTLSLILAHGPAILVHQESTGTTPQHWASTHSRPNLLSRLLAFGAHVDAKDSDGWTPLHVALVAPTRSRSHACARMLLQHGADMCVRDSRLHCAPLHFAATSARVEELRALLDLAKRLNVNVVDGNGQTPLHWAAAIGRAGVVEVLLKRGANVGVRDGRGMTPLHVVARRPCLGRLSGKFETVAWLLIRRGADGTIRDRSGSRVVDVLGGRRSGAATAVGLVE